MPAHAERGLSAPPEVVFNTATDPHRAAAWLPLPLRACGAAHPDRSDGQLQARWAGSAPPGWSAELTVRPAGPGGAQAQFTLQAPQDVGPDPEQPGESRLTALADESLTNLAREVAENLTAG